MTRRTQGFLLMLTGLVAFRLVLTGTYDSYVQPGMRIPLLGTSAFLVVLGVGTAFAEAWRADRDHSGRESSEPSAAGQGPEATGRDHHEPHDHHDHDEHRPWVGWLLAAPLAVLVLVAPAPLGADAASRQEAYVPAIEASRFPELPPPSDGAVNLRIGEFVDRAIWDEGGSLDDAVVRLKGFVVHDPQAGDDYVLARFRISCCAADAIPVKIIVRDGGPRPEENQWLAVTGTLESRPEVDPATGRVPPVTIVAASVEPIPEPAHPYE